MSLQLVTEHIPHSLLEELPLHTGGRSRGELVCDLVFVCMCEEARQADSRGSRRKE